MVKKLDAIKIYEIAESAGNTAYRIYPYYYFRTNIRAFFKIPNEIVRISVEALIIGQGYPHQHGLFDTDIRG